MTAYFKYLGAMTSDLAKNAHRIWMLALFEYKLATKDLFLGGLWRFLNPMTQIGVYWFVFGIGLRNGKPIDGIPYVVWLTCGLAPWHIMNSAVTRAASSIRGKAAMLTRSNIATPLVPVSTVLSEVLSGFWTILLLFIIFLGSGCRLDRNALCLVYYVLCMFALLAALSLVTSVLVLFAKDFSNLLQAFMRLAFFASPVFWKPGNTVPEVFHAISFFNPFAYLIDGFRESLLFHTPFWDNPERMAAFWGTVFVLYMIGAVFQCRLRKNLLDFL